MCSRPDEPRDRGQLQQQLDAALGPAPDLECCERRVILQCHRIDGFRGQRQQRALVQPRLRDVAGVLREGSGHGSVFVRASPGGLLPPARLPRVVRRLQLVDQVALADRRRRRPLLRRRPRMASSAKRLLHGLQPLPERIRFR